jgi:hydroxyacylglutathione hydrolase
MFFKQYSLDGLACQSYFVGDGDSAVVVDPQRDVDIYLETAREQGLTIQHVIDTHLHADHVSGNTELAHRTGAVLHIHPAAEARYPHVALREADEVRAGAVRLRALFTPGHTPDHISLAVTDTARSDEPWFVLTGDWVFVGDIGRPDLLGQEASRRLAGQMYDSIHAQLAILPDSVELYPGHGAGSLCGRAMSAKLSSTVGFERRFNPSLGIEDKEEFVKILTTDLPSQPPNVAFIKKLNREGPPVLGELAAHHLSVATVRRMMKEGAVLVDTREPGAFGSGHARGTLNIVLSSGQFATRLGFLVAPGTAVIFIARGAEECLSAFRAAVRVGLDRVKGYLTAAEAKALPAETLPQMSSERLRAALKKGGVHVLDVRERSEYAPGHVPGAQWIPLGQLAARMGELPKDGRLAVICAGGMRSSSAASLLMRSGFNDVVNVTDGFDGWVKAGLPIERK